MSAQGSSVPSDSDTIGPASVQSDAASESRDRSELWRIAAVSVVGTSHERLAIPCQDAHAVRVRDDGTLIVAVADGAGSAPRSREGSRLAVEQVVASLDSLLTLIELDEAPDDSNGGLASLMVQAVTTARACLEALASSEGASLRDFACTLSCALVTADHAAVAQIGDGLVVLRDPGDGLTIAVVPQRGEYANETPMLTSADALETLAVEVSHSVAVGIAIMSDGLLRLAADTSSMKPHRPFFAPLFAWLAKSSGVVDSAPLEVFMASERVTSRTDDDKTLVLALRAAD